jgi:hypothetical protein
VPSPAEMIPNSYPAVMDSTARNGDRYLQDMRDHRVETNLAEDAQVPSRAQSPRAAGGGFAVHYSRPTSVST